MQIARSKKQRRTEDAGSSGCPADSVGCNTNPNVHDLTPVQASSLSHSLAASSASSTSPAAVTHSGGNTDLHSNVNPQVVVGIAVIAVLILAFTTIIGYIAFGARGERCCSVRKNKKRQQQLGVSGEAGVPEASSSELKGDSEAHLVQKA